MQLAGKYTGTILALALLLLARTAIASPPAMLLDGTWHSTNSQEDPSFVDLELRFEGEAVLFTRRQLIKPAQWILCGPTGTFPAGLVSALDGKFEFLVDLSKNPGPCQGKKVTCELFENNQLRCKWVDSTIFILKRIARD